MLTHVDKPLRISGVTVPNRIARAAHGTRIGGGLMTEELIAYHELRARGGVGLTILEIMGVHPSSPSRLNSYEQSQPERFATLVDRIRPHGMKLFQQLWHGGHNASTTDGSAPWSASDVASPSIGVVPIPMTRAMINEVVGSFATAAANCEAWGLDGVELHAGHGYLFSQFLSAYHNNRTDEYGGSPENRARFLVEALTAVRGAVSREFPVGVRVAPDYTTGGVTVGDCIALVKLLEDQGLVDFVDVSAGNKVTYPIMIGGMHEPSGYQLNTSAQITAAARSPTIVTGRFRTLEEADQVIREGTADLVSMVRATIADPFLVRKSLDGRPEQVRPCIGCNQGCVGQVLAPPYRMGCTVNPSTGYELQFGDHMIQPAAPRRVFVVGGGPAGMEAARVAALRGHAVTLAEAQSRLGGALNLAAQAPTRAGIGDIGHWLEAEIYRLGVDVRLSTYVDVEDIRAERPDAVVVATGSMPRMDGIQISNPGEPTVGVELPHVKCSHEVFDGFVGAPGADAVVMDDVGHYEGVAVAEQLAAQGMRVTYVSRTISFAPRMESALMTEPALERFSRYGIDVILRSRAVAIDPEAVTIAPTYTGRNSSVRRLPASLVVLVSNNRPSRVLYDELAGEMETWLVGDAQSPRFLPIAIREGHLAGARVASASATDGRTATTHATLVG
jgi:2,4-dienoyl-CoA reductase-like NADH-dependent reductase (Old Yellow Enzyme family)/thioredoxin reductase